MTHPSGRPATLAQLARAAAPLPGGSRPHCPPAPSSRPGRGTESFPGLAALREAERARRGGGRRAGPPSAWCGASGPRVRRSWGGAGLSPAPEPPCSRAPGRLPLGPPRGSRSSAMSRLLPLLGSRTARSLRPGPAAAPRPPSWCGCGRGLLALGVPGGGRLLGTHPKKEPMEALNTAQGARDFIYSLHSTERSCLLKELHRFESIAIAQGKRVGPPWKTSFSDPCALPTRWPRVWDVRKGETFHYPSVPKARRTRAGRACQLGPSRAAASLAVEFRSFGLKCQLTLRVVFWFVLCHLSPALRSLSLWCLPETLHPCRCRVLPALRKCQELVGQEETFLKVCG